MTNQDERKFLHDISTPVSSIGLILESVSDLLSESLGEKSTEVQQLQKAQAALGDVIELIREHKQHLVENS